MIKTCAMLLLVDAQQELHNNLISMAAELERTPSKTEFFNSFPKLYSVFKKIYNERFTDLCLAAGLVPNQPKRITNKIFETNIEKHLEKHREKIVEDLKPLVGVDPVAYPSIAIISDIHWPFENPKVLKTFNEYVGDVKPEHVVINGDAWDMYSHSKFPRSHNIFTPRDEQYMARQGNEQFWERIKLIHPEAKCLQTLGNHDIRPMRRVMETYPEAEDWIAEKMKQMFSFDGVKTVFDSREEVYFAGDILIFHGYRTKLGDHRDFTLYNTINGHSHVGGAVFRKVRGKVLWELNSGLAGDPEAKGLTYTPQRITNWTPGFAAVTKYGPQFIHV